MIHSQVDVDPKVVLTGVLPSEHADMIASEDPTMGLFAFLGRLGWMEIALILAVVLLLFGGRKLPDLARGLARGLKIFKKEMRDVKDEFSDAANPDPDDRDDSQGDAS